MARVRPQHRPRRATTPPVGRRGSAPPPTPSRPRRRSRLSLAQGLRRADRRGRDRGTARIILDVLPEVDAVMTAGNSYGQMDGGVDRHSPDTGPTFSARSGQRWPTSTTATNRSGQRAWFPLAASPPVGLSMHRPCECRCRCQAGWTSRCTTPSGPRCWPSAVILQPTRSRELPHLVSVRDTAAYHLTAQPNSWPPPTPCGACRPRRASRNARSFLHRVASENAT